MDRRTSRRSRRIGLERDESYGTVRTDLAAINIIPLVDVVLVLLLIFMLTAQMMYRGIDVNLAGQSGKSAPTEERMILTITTDQTYRLNDTTISGPLEATLSEVFRTRKDRSLYIQAESAVSYGAVIDAMDRARRAGIENVGMVTQALRSR